MHTLCEGVFLLFQISKFHRVRIYGLSCGSYLITQQKDLRETLDTIKANIGFDKLQDMRANSPTGGALGQVSEFENRLLQAVQGSLDQSQSAAQLKQNLEQVKQMLQMTREFTNVTYNTDYKEFIGPRTEKTGKKETEVPKETAPQAAIEMLRSDPKLLPQFVKKYGYTPEGF